MRVITEDLWFPEGPVWVGDGSLLVVEIRRKTLTRVWPDGRKSIVANLGGGPNGAAIGPDGYCYVCNNGGFKFAQRADGRWVSAGTPDDYVTGRIERVDIETGKFDPSLPLAFRAARLFGLRIEEIFHDEDGRNLATEIE